MNSLFETKNFIIAGMLIITILLIQVCHLRTQLDEIKKRESKVVCFQQCLQKCSGSEGDTE